jgi:hypothetical protein
LKTNVASLVYRTPSGIGPEQELVGAINCTVVQGSDPSNRTVSFYCDYGSSNIPASTGLLITVERIG